MLFHVNLCSLSKNFEELQYLLKSTNKNFDIIAITETRTRKDISITNNLSLNNYSFGLTSTESSAGSTLLYIANHLSYKPHNDLNIYKKSELEPTFIEVIILRKVILLLGVSIDIPLWTLKRSLKNKNHFIYWVILMVTY